MKRIVLASAMSFMAILLMSSAPVIAGNGNGAPSGPHFNLNLIGAKTTNCPSTEGPGGHVIFVALGSKGDVKNSKILLTPGADFAVTDNNACIDNFGGFTLPTPGTYTIWARVEGTPGGSGALTTCAIDPGTGEDVCLVSSPTNTLTIGTRDNGPKFQDVTSQLTNVCTVALGCIPLFSSSLTSYFWSYDNQGNKVLQLRFYPSA